MASESLARTRQSLQEIGGASDAYAEGVLLMEEYRESKERLINNKLSLKEKLALEERQRHNRVEPAIEWLKTLKWS